MIRIRSLEESLSLSSQGGEALNASELVAFKKNISQTMDPYTDDDIFGEQADIVLGKQKTANLQLDPNPTI